MALLVILAATLPAAVLVGTLVHLGFKDGDSRTDARVRVDALAPAAPAAAGQWVAVRVTNPPGATVLVGVRLRPSRRPRWLAPAPERHTAGRRVRPPLGGWTVGAVAPGAGETFWLWAEGDLARARVEVAAGTTGRLRLHSLPLPPPQPAERGAQRAPCIPTSFPT